MRFDTTTVGPRLPLTPSPRLKLKSGATIEALSLTGTLDLSNLSNITVRHCRIDAANAPFGIRVSGASNIRIEQCEITSASAAAVFGQGFIATACNVHHCSGDGFKPGAVATIANNWVHHLGYKSAGAHADGVQIIGGHDIAITGNFFDLGIDVPDTHSNSSLMIQHASKTVSFTGNLCKGGNYLLNGDADASSVCAKNTFVRGSARYGFFRVAGMTWAADNTFDDGSPCAAHDK